MSDYNLDHAYEIDGPESAKRLYGEWAKTYDDSFADDWGFVAPRLIAATYIAEDGDNTPILDIGAGTGQVAEHLGGAIVDGIDITPEMLAVAKEKGKYRTLVEGDLLKPLQFADKAYGGVISCGTFTHGHVGPACLPELLARDTSRRTFCLRHYCTSLGWYGFRVCPCPSTGVGPDYATSLCRHPDLRQPRSSPFC